MYISHISGEKNPVLLVVNKTSSVNFSNSINTKSPGRTLKSFSTSVSKCIGVFDELYSDLSKFICTNCISKNARNNIKKLILKSARKYLFL